MKLVTTKFKSGGLREKQVVEQEWLLCIKINIHFWSFLAQFFLDWEIFWTKVVDKIKKNTFYAQ